MAIISPSCVCLAEGARQCLRMLEHCVCSSGIFPQERVCTANLLSAVMESMTLLCSWAGSHKRMHSRGVSLGLFEKIQVEDTVRRRHYPFVREVKE